MTLLAAFSVWLQRRREAKCQAVGHRTRTRIRRGLRVATRNDYRAVAVKVTEQRIICRRCGTCIFEQVVDGDTLQSLSLPTDEYEQLHRDGVLWTRVVQ